MSKFYKFIFKYLSKLSLLIPLLFGNNDNIIVVIILLLIIYLQSNQKFIKSVSKRFIYSKNSEDNSDNEEEKQNVNSNKDDETTNQQTKSSSNQQTEQTEQSNDILKNNINEIYVNMKTDNKKNITQQTISNNNVMKENLALDKNIKIITKKIKNTYDQLEYTPYQNNRRNIKKNYIEKPENYDFKLNINSSLCSTPMFTLRTYEGLGFYYNFLLHTYNCKKIHNLLMCKDICKWMSGPTLSDDDIENELVPVYLVIKINERVDVYEYLKIFINKGEDGKIAFIQKGNDYLIIEKYINELIDRNIISDLLEQKLYTSYNLETNKGINDFLNKFLSLVLLSEENIGQEINLDIGNYYENKMTYEYFLKTLNETTETFNTSI